MHWVKIHFHQRHLAMRCILVMSLFAPALSVAQVYRCTVRGQVIYQQTACAPSASEGHEIPITPAPDSAVHAAPPWYGPPSSEEPQPPASTLASPPAQPRLDPKSEQCANWYLRRLVGPTLAHVLPGTLEKGILTLTITVPGPWGTAVRKQAACEFRGEAFDEGWTQEHAKRLGW